MTTQTREQEIMSSVLASKMSPKKKTNFIEEIVENGPIGHYELGHVVYFRNVMSKVNISPTARNMKALYEYIYEGSKDGMNELKYLLKQSFGDTYFNKLYDCVLYENIDDAVKEFIDTECILSKQSMALFVALSRGRKLGKVVDPETTLGDMKKSLAKRVLKAMEWLDRPIIHGRRHGRRPASELIRLAKKYIVNELESVVHRTRR